MKHRERIERIIAGEKVDRPAVSMWRHFYHLESTAQGLCDAMVGFQREYDWDIMKINPRASYHMEDWGNELDWSNDELKKHSKTKFAVETIDDWDKIIELPMDSPVLGEHLEAVSLIRKEIGNDLPIVMTMFTPLSIAGDLVKDDNTLLEHLRENPEKVKSALGRIAKTFANYAKELRNAGADGLFYATTQWASRTLLTFDEYLEFGKPFDLIPLEATGDGALNILHVCASENYLSELANYPAQIVNWDDSDPTNLNVKTGTDAVYPKTVMAGIDHRGWLQSGTPKDIELKIRETAAQAPETGFIFGPGCSIAPETPSENLRALRDTIESLKH